MVFHTSVVFDACNYNTSKLSAVQTVWMADDLVFWTESLLQGGDELANHLSRNNPFHDYKETEEEVLITVLKKLKGVLDSTPANTRHERATTTLVEIRGMQDKNTRLLRVLHHEKLCMLLASRLLYLGTHFRRRPEFSVTWLAKGLDVCMGIYLMWIEQRTITLRMLGSRSAFPSYKQVSALIDKADDGNTDAQAEIAKLRKIMEESDYGDDDSELTLWAEVLDSVDKHALDAFDTIRDSIGQMTPTYVMRLSSYRQGIINSMRNKWSINANKDYSQNENEILQHLDRVVARVALFLTPKEGETHAPEPLLGGFMMDYAWSTFNKLKLGLAEICRWFEVFLDYWRILHPKGHAMDDWSVVMLSNIAKDPRFPSQNDVAGRDIVDNIWAHRGTLVLRLNNLMMKEKKALTPRPKDKKTLDAAFEKLPENERIASEALTKILLSHRSKTGPRSRDFALEPKSIAGMMALHTTTWDWLSPTIKNTQRDIDPCMKAIAVERTYLVQYRAKLLKDKLFELSLEPRMKKLQTLDPATGKLRSGKVWVWWDNLNLTSAQGDPSVVLKALEDKTITSHKQTQARLTLEQADREEINKLIGYFCNLPCVRATRGTTSLVSADVMGPFRQVIQGIEINTARKRYRTLEADPEAVFDLAERPYSLGLGLPDSYADPHTIGYGSEYSDEDDADKDENPQVAKSVTQKGKGKGKGKDKGKGKGKQRAVQVVVESEPSARSTPSVTFTGPTVIEVIDSNVPTPAEMPAASSPSVSAHTPTVEAPLPPASTMPVSTPVVAPSVPLRQTTATVVPKPRPVPRKHVEIPVQSVDEHNVEVSPGVTTPTTSRPAPVPGNVCPLPSTDPDTNTTPRPTNSALVETCEQEDPDGDKEMTDAVDTVLSASDTLGNLLQSTLPSITPSPQDIIDGFSADDIGWFNPDDNDNEEDDDDDEPIEQYEPEYEPDDIQSEDHSEPDDPDDASYMPTQPLTQQLPPRRTANLTRKERRVASSSAKRSRAATGASSSSSTQGRGSKQKKKSKVAVQGSSEDEADNTIVPISIPTRAIACHTSNVFPPQFHLPVHFHPILAIAGCHAVPALSY
ncbi:uncharacterized protein EDB93DRAFT_1110324 [Suillus bovinus]|uniref:uncharacterized protein n=1 Tax=Suillus bovinus TaxID=48563 RepID=UPI001B86B7A5|nr:uncharacterized protein EDB93DRAFT_1110324 [Suillus bovinus]KAG2125136.1 hypothetical protein EDB93DRAFT_1110324 [Suillus bovinus]